MFRNFEQQTVDAAGVEINLVRDDSPEDGR